MSDSGKAPRLDIQALRGYAVLIVVLYHTQLGAQDGGYLGVDVFFVISGFLITTLVAVAIERGAFRLKDFYFRRAKRLLPAAYVTFGVTAVLAPWFLNRQELRDFALQLVGALSFTGNFVLWQQTGYFEGAGDLKPLLHVWSLAIEEQYYLLLPAVLLLFRPGRWLAVVVVCLVLSLALCVAGGLWKPVATFYLLPTRAWELLIGSAGALWTMRCTAVHRQVTHRVTKILFIPAVAGLLLLPWVPFKGAHPGIDALLVCLATLVVILRGSRAWDTTWPVRLLARVGDFSYSLYLVHWPIVAFTKNAWVGSTPEVPIDFRIGTLVLSFVLAYLQYRFVEEPVRRSSLRLTGPLVGKLVIASVMMVSVAPAALHLKDHSTDFDEVRRTNFGFSQHCASIPYQSSPECQDSPQPSLLVWGDSYAMHLVAGVAREWRRVGGEGTVQATKSQCGPFLGLAPRQVSMLGRPGDFIDEPWARGCIAFNDSVLAYLRAMPAIGTVVLSSPFGQYLTQDNYLHVVQEQGGFSSQPVDPERATAALARTIEEIRALGRKVVVVAPPPSTSFNIGGCLERQLSGKVAFGGRPGCTIDRAEYEAGRAAVADFLAAVSARSGVEVIRFDPWLCDETVCRTLVDGTMIYRDGGHLSYAGSELLAERMELGRMIRTRGR